MSEPLLPIKEIIHAAPHLAIALKSLPENKAKPLEELIVPAARLLIEACDALETELTRYMLRRNKEQSRKDQVAPDQEAAVLFMPKDKNVGRRTTRFNEFKEFMRNPVELVDDEYFVHLWQRHRREIETGNWTYGFCQDLREYFPKWGKIKKSRAQLAEKN